LKFNEGGKFDILPSPKKKRQRISSEQLDLLEQTFETDKMPNQKKRIELASKLGMSMKRVQIWFQNRRAKLKRLSSIRSTSSFAYSPEVMKSPRNSISSSREEEGSSAEPILKSHFPKIKPAITFHMTKFNVNGIDDTTCMHKRDFITRPNPMKINGHLEHFQLPSTSYTSSVVPIDIQSIPPLCVASAISLGPFNHLELHSLMKKQCLMFLNRAWYY
jgi:hypothetical protein